MEDARSQHTRSSFRGVGSRATNELRGNRPERKKSAAERLEADKIKYVKSAHVREKRITAASISPHNDSTGTYSMSSTGSPTRIDDDEDDQPAAAGGGESRLPLAQSLPLPVPQVEATGKQRSRPPVAKPRQHNEVVVVDQSPLMSKSYQSKSMSNKFYDCVYKAKESLRPVVQTIRFDEMTTTITTTTTTSQENPPPRQSRTSSRSTKPRSASVGPNVRTTHHERFYEQQLTKSKAGLISPRTQLKQARDGLKKVKDDHRFGVRSARPNQLDVEGATFHHQNATVAGVKDSRAADGDQDGKQPQQQQQHRSKPLAIIENNIVLSCTAPKQRSDTMPMKAFAPSPAINRKAAAMEANAAAEMESAESTRRGKHNKIMYANGGGCTKRSAAKKSPKEDSTAGTTTTTTTEVATNNSQAKRAQVPKLMSPSAYHHQQQHNIISCGGGGTNELLVRNILPNTPRQRRSWSKNPNEASAASRKHHHHHNSRRAVIQQEGNRPGSRKSISERLGEILTPLEDMDTVNMPPPPMATRTTAACYENTPTESNTVIAHNNQTTAIIAESPTPAVVSVSNNAAGQTVYGRVDQAPSARGATTTATADDYKSFPSSSNSAGASGRSFNKSNNVGPPQSPSLAPRTRREVAPTDKKRSSEHHHHHHHDKHTTTTTNSSGDDIRAQSTLQSHNTSSSAATSADVSKPLTALTASDLKPRRTKRNTTSSAVTPLRAAHPYPPYNGHADKLRRQTTAAATPPTQSPLRPPSSSSRRNSYHQQHRGSNAAVILLQDSKSEAAKLNNFFATMGGYMPSHSSNENICFNIDCESDFSFAGASAYVREDDECNMEVEMKPGAPYQAPSVSIIEKHARIMQWIMSCRSQMNQQQQQQSSNHLSCFVAPKESSV